MRRGWRTTRAVATLAIAFVAAESARAQSPAPAASPTPVPAASASPPPAFHTIRPPTSPAFTLLGAEPSSVERPNTPSSLAVSLLSRAARSETVPSDFALEVSPYWLISHARLRWSDDDARTPWQSLARTASVSIATGQTGTKDLPVTSLGIGGRASLFSGRLTEDTKKGIRNLEALLHTESALALKLMAEQLKALNASLKSGDISAGEYTRLVDALQRSTVNSKAYRESSERRAVDALMQKFAVNREGFFLEVAGAAGWDYPKAVWDRHRFRGWGVWATPSYQTAGVSAVGVMRYLSKADETGNRAFDLGARATYSSDRYAVSLEFVHRAYPNSDLSAGRRLVGIGEYAIADDKWLVASFGRDHPSGKEGSLVARLGLSFNFSKERYDFDKP